MHSPQPQAQRQGGQQQQQQRRRKRWLFEYAITGTVLLSAALLFFGWHHTHAIMSRNHSAEGAAAAAGEGSGGGATGAGAGAGGVELAHTLEQLRREFDAQRTVMKTFVEEEKRRAQRGAAADSGGLRGAAGEAVPANQQQPPAQRQPPQEQQQQQPQQQAPPPPPLPPPPPAAPAAGDVAEGSDKALVHPVEGHRILGLSDQELWNTPMDTMMSWYPRGRHEKNCEEDFGSGLIRRWRGKKKAFCTAPAEATPQQPGGARLTSSHVDCYLMKQNRHHGNGDNLCHGQNVAISFKPLNTPQKTQGVMKRYVDTRHADQAYMHFSGGEIMQAACKRDRQTWSNSQFPGWNEDWMWNGFAGIGEHGVSAGSVQCDEWVDHKVLISQRDTFANFFHASEDTINLMIAMSVLQWSFGDTQLFFTDLYPEGPFYDMYKSLAPPGRAPMTAWDLKERFQSKTVCFKDVAVGIYGPAAPTTVHTWTTPCFGTALVQSYSDIFIRSMGLAPSSAYRRPASKRVTVTYMARRSSVIWPERRFCDDRFFQCSLFQHLGTRKLGRVIRNDADVANRLKALEKESFSNGAEVVVQDVDFNKLSMEEQLRVDLETDILVGPHGAGLQHTVFLRDRGVLIELWVDGSGGLRHFENLSRWYGRKHVGQSMSNPVPLDQVYKMVHGAIAGMDLSKP